MRPQKTPEKPREEDLFKVELGKIIDPRCKMKHRSAIKPVIGHLKNEPRIGRNYRHGMLGNVLNPIVSDADFNMRKLYKACCAYFVLLFKSLFDAIFPFLFAQKIFFALKTTFFRDDYFCFR